MLRSALGGECLDDWDHLRRDDGLAALLGYHLPAASTARQWLDQCHDPEVLEERPPSNYLTVCFASGYNMQHARSVADG